MEKIEDHTYYEWTRRPQVCVTCGEHPSKHKRFGWQVEHEYAYEWGCRCSKCRTEHTKRARDKKSGRVTRS